ncbi:MAG TPA: bifunctional DNA primase/polymerase, partial [Pirellulales bacterium]|nr:bifunctional DNA primase/polymerase [Pirellulales bacterium]
SGIVVLDIDTKHGVNGFDSLAELGRSALPETPMAHTPHGGLHLYFAERPNLTIRCSESVIGPGLDVRGEGGSITLPTPGWGYRWDDQHPPSLALRRAPSWLAARRQNHGGRYDDTRFHPSKILHEACAQIRAAQPGQRHHVINRQAFLIGCIVAAGKLDEYHARHELEAAAMVVSGDDKKTARDLNDAFAAGLRKREKR